MQALIKHGKKPLPIIKLKIKYWLLEKGLAAWHAGKRVIKPHSHCAQLC
jgi:hypothetical protein